MDVVSGARRSSMMFVLFLCLVVGHVSSFRITRLDVPSQVTEGSTARMACEYELVPYRKLYTVRWMKNNVEFYRYDPNSEERHNFYRIHGLHVNTERSNSTVVYIDHVSREDTEGLYTCEVTTFPSFARTSESKRMTVVEHAADAQELKKDEKGHHRHGRKNNAVASQSAAGASTVIAILFLSLLYW